MNNNFLSDFVYQEDLFESRKKEIFIDFEKIFSSEQTQWRLSPNVFLIKSESSSQLIISGYGVKLAKKSERIVIKDGDDIFYEIPFFKVSHINIQSKGVSITSDLIEEASKRDIMITFIKYNGKPYSCLSSPYLNATVKTRREQIIAYNNKKGVEFAKTIIKGKLKNEANLIKYSIKNIKFKQENLFSELSEIANQIENNILNIDKIDGSNCDEIRQNLLNIEAVSTKKYWNDNKNIIEGKYNFDNRTHRGIQDEVNSLLNYGYGMLYSTVWTGILNAGLEPFAGFIHIDRSGRPSLVLDMVEEFRAPVIDRTVISFVNKGENIKLDNGLLSLETRKNFAQKVLERLETYEYYNGKKFQLKSIIQIQARKAASFFREGEEYNCFSFKW